MAQPNEKQGALQELSTMTCTQLLDLKQRQLNILANKKFVSRLPDKGEKLQLFVKRLEVAIGSAAEVDTATELMKRMAISNADSAEIQNQLRGVLNTACNQKIYTTIQEKSNLEENQQTFAYTDRILEKATKTGKVENKFIPNRAVKAEHIEDIPTDRQPQTTHTGDAVLLDVIVEDSNGSLQESTHSNVNTKDSDVCTENPTTATETVVEEKVKKPTGSRCSTEGPSQRRLRYTYDENLESEIERMGHKYKQAKFIAITDSFKLQQESEEKIKRLQSEQAARRLAQRFNVDAAEIATPVKVDGFKPEGTSYRTPAKDDSDDDDDDTEARELDYMD